MDEMDRLRRIMAALRDPQTGCPWDIEQSFETIAPYTIEEAYEVADAIARRDMDDLRGELGDLLLQVVYHARMAEEAGAFDLEDVARGIADKMVARHPHVFGDASRDKTAEQQTRDWEAAKEAERRGRGEGGVLDGVALGMPALMRAAKLQKRAARVGFDWPDDAGVAEKIAEEARELTEARGGLDPGEVEGEVGDMLFALANLARRWGIDPEAALRRTNDKFVRRFGAVERGLADAGRDPRDATLEEMDALWTRAKRAENT